MKIWVVTAVDYGDSCDGKARVLSVCKTEEEARAYVRNDMEEYVDDATDDNGNCSYETVDFAGMCIYTYNRENGCEWNIEEVDFTQGE